MSVKWLLSRIVTLCHVLIDLIIYAKCFGSWDGARGDLGDVYGGGKMPAASVSNHRLDIQAPLLMISVCPMVDNHI